MTKKINYLKEKPDTQKEADGLTVSAYWAAIIIFVVAFILKLLFLLYVRDNPFVASPTNDEVQHLMSARDILAYGILQDDAFYFAPLYSYLLAGFISLFGESLFAFKILQVIAGALNVVLVFFLSRLLFKNWMIAITAGCLTLLCGVYYFYEVLLLKTTFAVLLGNLGLFLLFLAMEKGFKRFWFLSGVVFGLGSLIRGNVLVMIAFIMVGILIECRRGKAGYYAAAIWLAGIMVGIFPATLHNAMATGDFVLTTYQGGSNFYIGNHEGASGCYIPLRKGRHLAVFEKQDAVSIAEEASGRKLKPSEVSGFWMNRSLEFISGSPGNWLALMLKKMALFHSNAEFEDTIGYPFFRSLAPLLWIAFIPTGLIFAFAVPGIILSLDRRRENTLLYLALIGSSFSVIMFFIFSRYRVPCLTLYIVFAAYSIMRFYEFARKRRLKKLFLWVSVSLTCFIVSLAIVRPFSLAASYNNLGTKYAEMNEYGNAILYFQKAIERSASEEHIAGYRFNLANAYNKSGDPCLAADTMRYTLDFYRREALKTQDRVLKEAVINISRDQVDFLERCGRLKMAEDLRIDIKRRYSELVL